MKLINKFHELLGFLETEELSIEQGFVAGIAIGFSDFEGNIEEVVDTIKHIEICEKRKEISWEEKCRRYIELFETINDKRSVYSPKKKSHIVEMERDDSFVIENGKLMDESKESDDENMKDAVERPVFREPTPRADKEQKLDTIQTLYKEIPISAGVQDTQESIEKPDSLRQHYSREEAPIVTTEGAKETQVFQEAPQKMEDLNPNVDQNNFEYEEVEVDIEADQLQEEFYSEELIERIRSEELSMELIKKMQAEEESIELIKRIQEEEKIQSTKLAKLGMCEICTDDIPPDNFVIFDKCGHMFHPECVKPYLQKRMQRNAAKLTCPETDCTSELLVSEVRNIVGFDEYEKYEKVKLKSFFG